MTIAYRLLLSNYSVFSICIIKSRVLIRGIIHYDLGCSRYYNAVVYSCAKPTGIYLEKPFKVIKAR